MEHRCSVRKSMEFRVLLYRHGLPVETGHSLDLGLDGVYVTTVGGWRQHEPLEVEFTGHRGDVPMRMPAIVVHRKEGGIGLMFSAITAGQRRQLRGWLFSKSEAMTAGEGDRTSRPGVGEQRAVA